MRKKRSRKGQSGEDKVARDIGGRVQPRSGGLPGFKGDVKTQHLLVESKEVSSKGLTNHVELYGDCIGEGLVMVDYTAYLQALHGEPQPLTLTPSPIPYQVRRWWGKIRREAMGAGKEPLLVLVEQNVAVMEEGYWRELNADTE